MRLGTPHGRPAQDAAPGCRDRKSTRLNSSHLVISYAVFCLKKKKKKHWRFPYSTQNTVCTISVKSSYPLIAPHPRVSYSGLQYLTSCQTATYETSHTSSCYH